MTSFQKIIKYGAIAFAIYLCFMIISMIVFGISAVFGITAGIEMFRNSSNDAMIPKWEQEYSNITSMDIDLSVCKLTIQKGDTLKVCASEVSDKFKCRVEGNRLKIEDQNIYRPIFNNLEDVKSEVIIYIPENMSFEEVKIETGVNETNIEWLKADNVNLEMGVGKYQINALSAKYAKIEAGAGEATIEHSNMEELKLDGGIGKLVFTGKITKTADIDCGVGKLEVNLIGLPTDYKIKAETGLGSFKVDGEKVSNNQTLGNGNVTVKVDAGVGDTTINYLNADTETNKF